MPAVDVSTVECTPPVDGVNRAGASVEVTGLLLLLVVGFGLPVTGLGLLGVNSGVVVVDGDGDGDDEYLLLFVDAVEDEGFTDGLVVEYVAVTADEFKGRIDVTPVYVLVGFKPPPPPFWVVADAAVGV